MRFSEVGSIQDALKYFYSEIETKETLAIPRILQCRWAKWTPHTETRLGVTMQYHWESVRREHVLLSNRRQRSSISSQIQNNGGGFLLACEVFSFFFFWRFEKSLPFCAFLFCFCVFDVEASSCAVIALFRTGSVHSGSASRDDCGRAFPDELRIISLIGSQTLPRQHSQPTPTSLGQGCMCVWV